MRFRGGHDERFLPAWLYTPRSSRKGAFSRRKATLEYAPMGASPIKFGTSGWRGLIADDFTFVNVRLAVAAISGHVKSRAKDPVVLVASDPRFYSEEFTRLAVEVLQENGIRVLQADTFAPTPAVAYEFLRRKLAGAINFTASHNPAQYHGLKLSSSDAGPALPEVTKDIEARVAKLVADGGRTPRKKAGSAPRASVETVSLAEPFLKRLGELVRFDEIRNSGVKFVVDPRHGSGVGYLDRFGIIDSDGTWISPNHVLALLYDYICETRGWSLATARSVATTHMLDAVAQKRGQKAYQTPVGFKYIGQLIREDKIALGGEESAGLSIRGHVPEKDGILACLLVAEMTAARGVPIREQIKQMFRKVGREFWPLRQNLHLTAEEKARAVQKAAADASAIIGRKVASIDRTDGTKFMFDDGSWMLCRLSGTEPLLRLYTEAESEAASARLAREAADWLLKG